MRPKKNELLFAKNCSSLGSVTNIRTVTITALLRHASTRCYWPFKKWTSQKSTGVVHLYENIQNHFSYLFNGRIQILERWLRAKKLNPHKYLSKGISWIHQRCLSLPRTWSFVKLLEGLFTVLWPSYPWIMLLFSNIHFFQTNFVYIFKTYFEN